MITIELQDWGGRRIAQVYVDWEEPRQTYQRARFPSDLVVMDNFDPNAWIATVETFVYHHRVVTKFFTSREFGFKQYIPLAEYYVYREERPKNL